MNRVVGKPERRENAATAVNSSSRATTFIGCRKTIHIIFSYSRDVLVPEIYIQVERAARKVFRSRPEGGFYNCPVFVVVVARTVLFPSGTIIGSFPCQEYSKD
jgi:hypothetical protein